MYSIMPSNYLEPVLYFWALRRIWGQSNLLSRAHTVFLSHFLGSLPNSCCILTWGRRCPCLYVEGRLCFLCTFGLFWLWFSFPSMCSCQCVETDLQSCPPLCRLSSVVLHSVCCNHHMVSLPLCSGGTFGHGQVGFSLIWILEALREVLQPLWNWPYSFPHWYSCPVLPDVQCWKTIVFSRCLIHFLTCFQWPCYSILAQKWSPFLSFEDLSAVTLFKTPCSASPIDYCQHLPLSLGYLGTLGSLVCTK